MTVPIAGAAASFGTGSRAEATRDVLAALMNVKTWIRETHQFAYAGGTSTSLLALALLDRIGRHG